MQGDPKVLEQLNAALSRELTNIAQYFTQAELCDNWGYSKMGAIHKKRAIDEMKHAEKLIERIVFLDAVPIIDVKLTPQIGTTVKQQLEFDLDNETETTKIYNQSVVVCRECKDDGSRDLFTDLIEDEEEHVDLLEAELHSISEMGIANFLQQMSGK
jgi:bacterioferritin